MSLLTGTGLGLLAGGGAWLVVTGTPGARRPDLDSRLAPYLRDSPRPSRLLARQAALTPFPTLERLLRPVLADLMRAVERWVGGLTGVRRRLEQAGGGTSVEQFRAEQVLWGGFGLAASLAAVLLGLASGARVGPLAVLGLAVAASVGGVLGRDRWLTRQVRRREERMLEEFPTIAELLALAVTAGEGPVGALERVTRMSAGELSRELRRALSDARAGSGLVPALEGVARRTSLPPLARFVDGVAIAVERGTPLADVLRAQAVDVREAGKRQLLEAAGRKEIAMMVRVVLQVQRQPQPQRGQGEREIGHGILQGQGGSGVGRSAGDKAEAVVAREQREQHGDRQHEEHHRHDHPERGDIPGWVLITIMTAGLVTAIWAVAKGQLTAILQNALDSVKGPA